MKKLFITTLAFILFIAPATYLVADSQVHAADDSLHTAISKALPATVTIVISKVTEQQVLVNPYGDDDLLASMGIEAPQYQAREVVTENVGSGSGFIISHDGYIVTNKHVVLDPHATYTVMLSNGQSLEAHVVYRDPQEDIALLKIDGTFPSIATFGSSQKVELGQSVVALGNAYGQAQNSISPGTISEFNKTVTAGGAGIVETLDGLLQSSADIFPGYSGGPLVDMNGNVIGINVAKDTSKGGSSFFIPIDELKMTLKKYPVN